MFGRMKRNTDDTIISGHSWGKREILWQESLYTLNKCNYVISGELAWTNMVVSTCVYLITYVTRNYDVYRWQYDWSRILSLIRPLRGFALSLESTYIRFMTTMNLSIDICWKNPFFILYRLF